MVKNLLFPFPFSWSSGVEACSGDSQVWLPGEQPCPLPEALLSGNCLSCETHSPWHPAPSHVQCDLGGNNNTGSGAALNPWTQLTQIPVHGRLNVRMWRALTCTARGCPGAGASSLSCVRPAPACPKGIARSLLCPLAPWDPGPAPWNHSLVAAHSPPS